MSRTIIVTDASGLLASLEALRKASRIAVDIEANNQHAYRAQMCVLQLCAAPNDGPASEVFVYDTLAIADLRPLEPLFRGELSPLVLHDVAFDARVLATVGMPLKCAIDTSLHARFLGLRETGLAALLQNRLGFSHEKAFQRHDWSQRPLTEQQLAYLSDDVRMLGALAALLEKDAHDAGISEEIAEETAWALGRAAVPVPVLPPYARIRQAKLLGPRQRAVLRELAQVRESHAERLDVPPTQLVSDRELIAATHNCPKTIAELRKVLRADDAALEADLLQGIKRGLTAGNIPEAEKVLFHLPPSPTPAEIARVRSRELTLSQWRAQEAKTRGVDPQVVLPGHVLSELARLGANTEEDLLTVAGLGAVRVRRYGAVLLRLLALPASTATPTAVSSATHVAR